MAIAYSPTTGNTLSPEEEVRIVWTGTAGTLDEVRVYATSLAGEELAYTGGDGLSETERDAGFSNGYTGTQTTLVAGSEFYYIYLTRASGWDSPTGTMSLRVEHTVSTTPQATSSSAYTVTPIINSTGLVTDHTEEAQGNVLSQFEDATTLADLIASYTDRVQELEFAVFPVMSARSIDYATTDRLDGIGQILDVARQGRTDVGYRLRLRAELLILKSNGTVDELIAILQALASMPTKTIVIDEYDPKTIYMRIQNFAVSFEDATIMKSLLDRARPAATELHLIYSSTTQTDEHIFRFSDTYGTGELSSDHGFNNSEIVGDL